MSQTGLFSVILIHGFSDIPGLTGSWTTVETLLRRMGVEYFTPQIPPWGGIEERSQSLIRQIAARYPGQTVHLFGHSMGGINARDIASKAMLPPGIGFQIHTVTTFGTPHRGVQMIDFAPSSAAVGECLRNIIGSDFRAFSNLTHRFMSVYNKQILNNPSVLYFSWAGVTEFPTPLFASVHIPSKLFGQTDGLVNASSAVWGDDLGRGIHLGTVAGLDHVCVINEQTVQFTIPHLQAAQVGMLAPIIPVDNNLVMATARQIHGVTNAAFAPARALFGAFGLVF